MGRQFDFRSKAMMGSDPHQYFPQQLSTPAYVQVEAQLRANLERIQQVTELPQIRRDKLCRI